MTENLMRYLMSYDISTFHFPKVSLLMCVQKGLKYIRLKCVSNNDISTFHFSFSGSYVYLFIYRKVSNILYLNTCQTWNNIPNYSWTTITVPGRELQSNGHSASIQCFGDTLEKRIVYFLLAVFEKLIYSLDLYFCVSKTSFNGCGFRIF